MTLASYIGVISLAQVIFGASVLHAKTPTLLIVRELTIFKN
jgi:hypothetical protein